MKLGMTTVLAFGALVLTACSSAQQQEVKTPAVDLSICVLTNVVPCLVAGTSTLTCFENTAKTCGADVGSVTSIYAAHVKAEVVEGFVPRPFDAGTGQ